MSKTDDLLKRAEELANMLEHREAFKKLILENKQLPKFIEMQFLNMLKYMENNEALIQELLDKLKGDAERLESKKLLEEVADNDDFTNAVIDAGNVFPHISPTDMETIARAAISVIKGDDDDNGYRFYEVYGR